MTEKPKFVPIPVIVWVRMTLAEKEYAVSIKKTDDLTRYSIDMMRKYDILKKLKK